ncbi:glycosyl hydrolase family 61-domain-containing protein, partial [Bipolaris maydis]
MKFFAAAIALLPALGSAHTIAQRVRVNGQDFGLGNGIRVASSNNPITQRQRWVGVQWGHVVGGAQPPIAKSHKGPAIFYMAKVSNAASASPSGLQWFKVAEDGLEGTTWGVDRMISNNGWTEFTVPSCIASGQYL